MPRMAREKSETGIYHVMLRGIDKRDIFLGESDYQQFYYYIQRAKEKVEFSIFAYCLMTNHVHLLLKVENHFYIGDIVKRIAVGYAQYHNIKNGRTGHLFQNRFKSEVVDSEAYFLTVLRYIHQNPVKAGLVKHMSEYKWSSYNEYFMNQKVLIDSTFALSLFSDIKHFEMFMQEKAEEECLDYYQDSRYTDEELEKYIADIIETDNLNMLDKKLRDQVLRNIKELTGASNRQLSRVLKIGRGVLERIS